jgi:putative transposase
MQASNPTHLIKAQETEPVQEADSGLLDQEYLLVEELSDDAQRKMEWVRQIRDAHSAFDTKRKKQLIQEAAKDLECHPRTVARLIDAVDKDGLIALTRNSRSDKGELRYISEPWRKLVIELYKRGNKYSRRTNRHQVWLLIQAITAKLNSTKTSSDESLKAFFNWIAIKLGSADESHTSALNKILNEIRDEVSSGELKPPQSHVAVYKILRAYTEVQSKKGTASGSGSAKDH